MDIVERFLKYVSFDTQSDESSNQTPSTAKQLELSKELVKDLKDLKIEDAFLDKYGIVYGTLKANTDDNVPTIGLIAHVDTSSACSGSNIKPKIINDYNGDDIILNESENIVMKVSEFESLKNNIHENLIVTDGKTLLGADDKAGVAIIMDLIRYLNENNNIKHGTIKIAFTPDEEVGRGTENFDVDFFNATYAYTLDGGDIHYVTYECFNACSVFVKINGKSIHPGSAKNKMVNANLVAMEFNSLLPKDELPEKTEKYEGFHHLESFVGETEKASLHYIVRNHDYDILLRQVNDFTVAADKINKKYGYNVIEVISKYSYRNMKEIILKHPEVLKKVQNAYKKANIEYEYEPIRGGTDGANLSFRGLPTPNLGTGGYNFHGPYEYLSINQMKEMVNILANIVSY